MATPAPVMARTIQEGTIHQGEFDAEFPAIQLACFKDKSSKSFFMVCFSATHIRNWSRSTFVAHGSLYCPAISSAPQEMIKARSQRNDSETALMAGEWGI